MAAFLARVRPAICEADDFQELGKLIFEIGENLASNTPDPELLMELPSVRMELAQRARYIADQVRVSIDASLTDLDVRIRRLGRHIALLSSSRQGG